MENSFALRKVEVSLSPQERFEEYLQSRGKRMTHQRRVILETVFAQHDHFDADGLWEMVQRAGHRVSRPTVYRTLNELEDCGLLRRMQLGNRRVYEHDYGYPDHDHLYCERCHKLFEFQCEELQRIREAVAREYQFRPNGHRFIITGVCSQCSQGRRRQRRLELV